MGKPIEQITIVGGGTAGWMAAAMLDAFLNRAGGGEQVSIRLIESPDAPTIGVGEATVPAMPRMLRQIGVDEDVFFKRCNASFKLAVKFVNWNVDDEGKPISFLNPFTSPPSLHGVDAGLYYMRFDNGRTPYERWTGLCADLIENCRAPGKMVGPFAGNHLGYAYHLDAGAFAGLLREVATGRGVEHIRDHVDDVELAPEGIGDDGRIAALHLRKGGRTPVELVIDCTGFQGLLINKALGSEFESYDKWMLNDRALAVQLPHKDRSKLEPATRSTALGAGWVWRVPLFHRIGTGYVFSSAFRTDEEAKAEFLEHLGLTPEEAQPRVLSMRVGRTTRSWVGNCVALGLSGGFVEPLESTAIYMIETGIRQLARLLPDSDFAPPLAKRYNREIQKLYEEVRDFIAVHYQLSNRDDTPYWREAKTPERCPDRLRENLDVWAHALPEQVDLETSYLFDYTTWTAVLFGKGFYRDKAVPRSAPLSEDVWRQFTQAFDAGRKQNIAVMPDHRADLARRRSGVRDRPADLDHAVDPDAALL